MLVFAKFDMSNPGIEASSDQHGFAYRGKANGILKTSSILDEMLLLHVSL